MSLADKLEAVGIRADGGIINKFSELTELMLEYNAHTNITGITSAEDIEDKHYIDSLFAVKHIPQGARLCDVGTGAGFPALAIAIVRPDVEVTAVDSVGKKIKFVKQASDALSLNVACLNMRAEGLIKTHARAYDVLTFRAVSDLKSITAFAPLVADKGVIIAYKGQESKASAEIGEVSKKEFLIKTVPYCLPKGDERTLVLLYRSQTGRK